MTKDFDGETGEILVFRTCGGEVEKNAVNDDGEAVTKAKEICRFCRFWKSSHYSAGGACRRYPPSLGAWPSVQAVDWCGEFMRVEKGSNKSDSAENNASESH